MCYWLLQGIYYPQIPAVAGSPLLFFLITIGIHHPQIPAVAGLGKFINKDVKGIHYQ